MLVRFIKKSAVDYRIHEAGTVAEVTESQGAQLLAAGCCSYASADEPSLERAAESFEAETATATRKRTRR